MNEKNDITDKELYKNDSYSKDNIINTMNNEPKKQNNDYIKDLFNKIIYERNILGDINKFEENISLGLTKLNKIKTNNLSVLDIKNQFKNEKMKNYPKFNEIISLLNKKIKLNRNNYNIDVGSLKNTKTDKINYLLNSFYKKEDIKNKNFMLFKQKIIEPKINIRKMTFSNLYNNRNSLNKLYVSCIDGKAISNGQRTQLRYSLFNINRKASNSSIIENSKYSENNNFFNNVDDEFIYNHLNINDTNKKNKELQIQNRLGFKRKYESFNKGYYKQKLRKIEYNLFKRGIK